MEFQTGILGDELTNYSQATSDIQQYTNSMLATGTYGPWTNAYNYIYQANAILQGLKDNKGIDHVVNQQLTGESKFIRAFWMFYLLNCYGDVPLVTSTDYWVNSSLHREKMMNVYRQIIDDLVDAQELLSSDFVGADNITSTDERVRPTKWAAIALLARSYLFTEKYDSAETAATAVINNNGMFGLCTDFDSVFLANSREAIWQLPSPLSNGNNAGSNTWEGYWFILMGQPSTATLSPQMMAAFEEGDNRKVKWVGSYTMSDPPFNTYYFPLKYKIQIDNDPSNTEEYTMMLRLAELYLIRAEARARQSNILGAVADLNVLRSRARAPISATIPNPLPDIPSTITQADVLLAILHERQVELFTEWGHRWFDLIRSQTINSVMGAPGDVCQVKGGIWKPDWQFFPIPQDEITRNPNLTQNSGY